MCKIVTEGPSFNIIVPLFNEELAFLPLTSRLTNLMNNSLYTFEVILVDDGSIDTTALLMKHLSFDDPRFHSVFLSRNFGHQLAVAAGLQYVNASDGVLVMDGDLQDPPELIFEMSQFIYEGFDVVYVVRKSRRGAWLLKMAYWAFYRIMKRFSYIDMPLDSGNFSLISRRVADHINSMPEESRFFSGMRSWVGFKQTSIQVDRDERKLGTTKYSYSKLISLALNGIFNFSKYPVRFTMTLGIMAIIISIVYFSITLLKKIFIGDVPTGFTALLFTIIMFGGLQLIAIGIIGEYVLRIFFQVKNRPLFIVKDRIQKGKLVDN